MIQLRKYRLSFVFAAIALVTGQAVLAQAPSAKAPSGNATAVLQMLPDETIAAVIIPRLSDLESKVPKLGGPLKMPIPGLLTVAKGMLQLQQGLNEQGSAGIALVATGADASERVGVAFLPASDYQKFIAQLMPQDKGGGISLVQLPLIPDGLLVGEKNGYAVFTGPTDADRKLLEAALKRAPAVPASFAAMQSWIGQQDVSYVLTTGGIKHFMQHARKGLEAGMAIFNQQPAAAGMADALKVYGQLFTAIEREAAQFAVGWRIENDATVRVVSRTRFVPGGAWAKAGAEAKTPAANAARLAGLPEGSYFFAFEGSLGGQAGQWMSSMSVGFMKQAAAMQPDNKATDEDWRKLEVAMADSMRGVQSISFLVGTPKPGQSMYSGMSGVIKVADSAAYLQQYEKSMTSIKELAKAINSPILGEYELKKTQIEGAPAVEISMDLAKMIQTMQQQQGALPGGTALFDKLFGPDGKLTAYLAAADRQTIVMTYVDPANLKALFASTKSPAAGLAASAEVKATVALLPKDAQWLVLISPAGAIEFVQTMLQAVAPQMPVQVPNFPNTPPVGIAARLGAESFDTEFVVPAALLDGVGTYIQQMRLPPAR